MAAKKKTVGQKRAAREREQVQAPVSKAAVGGTPFTKLVAELNKYLAPGGGRVYLGADYEEKLYSRRSTGNPILDYVSGGGFPRGGMVEIAGPYSVGKSSTVLSILAYEQRTQKSPICIAALEPFSKTWARTCGLWIPFSEKMIFDPATGGERPSDPFSKATKEELARMEELGITDPYEEVSPVVILEDSRGDALLDAVIKVVASNIFAYVVVDSLGIAKSTTYVEERGVQDSQDFDRTPKMIGDYTARCCLTLNKRYDENNLPTPTGTRLNETTIVNLNQVVTNIGTQAFLPWKKFSVKGGEGNKHNHQLILFMWRNDGDLLQAKTKKEEAKYIYGQRINVIATKSKICAPFKEGAFDFYTRPYGGMKTGDVDRAKATFSLGRLARLVEVSGSWFKVGDLKAQGEDAMADALRGEPEIQQWLLEESLKVLRE